MKKTISLNGYWDWHIPGGENRKMLVPGSYHCVGDAYYEKDIELNGLDGKEIFLRTEGIAYEGTLWINGIEAGSILPYCRFAFDITNSVNEGSNHITILIKDITAEYGSTSGWEDYGGITREVYIDVCDSININDFQWITKFANDYTHSDCSLKVLISNYSDSIVSGNFTIKLKHGAEVVYNWKEQLSVDKGTKFIALDFSIKNPALWSPDFPNLYELEMDFMSECGLCDRIIEQVGFREFITSGTRFLINGRDIFLKGVARHEMWGEHQGFTLTKEQIERDMQLIKQMGGNYVRLVHYPHHRYTIEVADRLGIMVSEEPGLWWSDLRNESIVKKALEIMKQTVLRDRNSPSVIFWLLFNECRFGGDYPKRGKDLCRSLDPTRLVSAANCMDVEDTRDYFKDQGLDFYTFHAYGYTPDKLLEKDLSMEKVLRVLNDMPVVFTEWGGWFIHNNSNLINGFKKDIARFSHNRAPEPNFAGMAWWQWQDIYQFYRGLPGCIDGLLSDGLVDKDRNRKPMYNTMTEFFEMVDNPYEPEILMEVVDEVPFIKNENMTPLCLSELILQQTDAWTMMLEKTNRSSKAGHHRYTSNIGPLVPHSIAGIGYLPVKVDKGRPLVINEQCPAVKIPVGFKACGVYFVGQVTYCEGYPVFGSYNDPVAKYVFEYADGIKDERLLKNGVDFSSASMVADGSRMNPMAVNTFRVLTIIAEKNWERYQVCCERFQTDPTRVLKNITIELADAKYMPLIYGITVDREGKEHDRV